MTQQKIYFEFIQFSLGITKELPATVANINWADFYKFAQKQALLGVVFDGIKRVQKELAPSAGLLTKWIGNSMMIKQRNQLMYKLSGEVYSEIRKMGFRCCVLKGQGNAIAYPNRYSRAPGDVDVWVMTNNRDELRQVANGLADSPSDIEREIVHHIELNRRGVSIELHPTPMIFNNPILNHRMQKWFARNADLQCSNIVDLPDSVGQIAIPTATFNAIYQLSHLHHHFFYEGVGLRQIVDYYYVLMGLPYGDTDIVTLQRELRKLGLYEFAGATMYVLHKVLGLSEDKMIVPVDDKRGKLLLDEILSGGNFGQYSNHRFGRGTLGHNLQRLKRDVKLIRYYPSEALAEPFFRVWHFFWRMKNK